MKATTEIHLDIEKVHELFWIPLYHFQAGVIVTECIPTSRKNLNHILGKYKGGNVDCYGLNSRKHSVFRVFFRPPIHHSTIAHELFHMTHGVMAVIGGEFGDGSEESYAYLNGALTQEVYRILSKNKVRIVNTK